MMELPLQLILFSIPSLIYITVRRLRGERWNEVFRKIGWQGSRPVYFIYSLGVMIVVGGLGWLAFRSVPLAVLQDPNVNISDYTGWTLSITSFLLIWLREAIYVALGEEIFFRGFLGGWLVRRFGFAIGNTVQTSVFLLPHLPLLFVSQSLWPFLILALIAGILALIAGWLLGWLRYRSNSILPGWLAHSLSNAFGALLIICDKVKVKIAYMIG
jgi:membrane protease YdiL (CAAX protease family)